MHLALTLNLPALLHPQLPALHTFLAVNGLPADADLPVEVMNDPSDADRIVFQAREVFTLASKLRGDTLFHDLISTSMTNAAVRLGDMIQKGGHGRTDVPLLQFARHFRNACSHGDVWNFAADGPPHLAACRSLTLSGNLVGQRATWKTVSPRLFVEFLDDISNYFVPGLVPPYSRRA